MDSIDTARATPADLELVSAEDLSETSAAEACLSSSATLGCPSTISTWGCLT